MSTIDIKDTPESIATFALARETFETFAFTPASAMSEPGAVGHLLPDSTFRTQALVAAWQTDRYGIVSDERQALGVIEELTETWMAAGDQENRDSFEDSLDGLGDVCVYASQLATGNRLAIGPIIDLARVYTKPANIPGGFTPMIGAGMLAQSVLKHGQKIRGMGNPDAYRRRLVRALAMCIAKAIDDIEMCHGTSVDARKVFEIVAREVMERKAGHPSIPTAEIDQQALLANITRIEVRTDDPDRFVHGLVGQLESKADK